MKHNDPSRGVWKAACAVCGFVYNSNELMMRWDGVYVCHKDYEPRNILDFFKVREGDISVPWSQPEVVSFSNTKTITPLNNAIVGVLSEEIDTNICLQSQTLGTTWSIFNNTLSENTTTAPDGTTTADKIEHSGVLGLHSTYQAITTSINQPYTLSIFVKAAEMNKIQISIDDGTSNGAYANLDLSTGTISKAELSGTGTYIRSAAYPLYDGWYLFCISGTIPFGATRIAINLLSNGLDGMFPNSSGSLGDGVYVWGVQMSSGNTIGNYVVTTTAAASNSASVVDVVYVDATSGDIALFLPNATEFQFPFSDSIQIDRIDESSYSVTIYSQYGEYIDGGQSKVIAPGKKYLFQTDTINQWKST